MKRGETRGSVKMDSDEVSEGRGRRRSDCRVSLPSVRGALGGAGAGAGAGVWVVDDSGIAE